MSGTGWPGPRACFTTGAKPAARTAPLAKNTETGNAPADRRLRRPPCGRTPHASPDAVDRAGRAAADVHGLARPDHPGDRAADHRARLQRRAQPAAADYRLSPGLDRAHSALRQDR